MQNDSRYLWLLLLLAILGGSANSQKIYSCDNKYDADLLVYKVENKYDAVGNSGLWYFTESKYDADKKIFFTDSKYDAELLIFFVANKYDAEWRKKSKMHLLF